MSHQRPDIEEFSIGVGIYPQPPWPTPDRTRAALVEENLRLRARLAAVELQIAEILRIGGTS